MNQIDKKYIILGSLCALVLMLAVGYAAFQSVLKIKGTSTINSNWDVRITGIEILENKGATDKEGSPTYDNEKGLSATFNTDFTTPGEYVTYKIEIKNNGSIDATLKQITMPENTNKDIVFYLNKDKNNEPIEGALEQDRKLTKATETENVGYVYVTVIYKDYENQKTPTKENETVNMTITFDFEQTDSSSETPEPSEPSVINMKGIEVPIVEEGTLQDGLYIDTYEEGRYVYKGANPNNYITFNNEPWRILSVETDGTLKIIRNSSIGDMTWCENDNNNQLNWNESTLYTYLNGTYYNNLNTTAKNQIVTGTFDAGEVNMNDKDLSNAITDEKAKPQSSKIALPTATEYVRASNNQECKSVYNYSYNDENKKCYYNAATHNWMFNLAQTSVKKSFWTLNKEFKSIFIIFVCGYEILADGGLEYLETTGSIINDSAKFSKKGVLPTIYLKSDITLSGSGTETDPYTIN